MKMINNNFYTVTSFAGKKSAYPEKQSDNLKRIAKNTAITGTVGAVAGGAVGVAGTKALNGYIRKTEKQIVDIVRKQGISDGFKIIVDSARQNGILDQVFDKLSEVSVSDKSVKQFFIKEVVPQIKASRDIIKKSTPKLALTVAAIGAGVAIVGGTVVSLMARGLKDAFRTEK